MSARTFDGRLVVAVNGRPAPQGSKRLGERGQMREASPYLPAWRDAVKVATYRAYMAAGVDAAVLPLFRGPVGCSITFRMTTEQRVDSAPDLDKLVRAVWDALTDARVWEDDGRVVRVAAGKRVIVDDEPTGADIVIVGGAWVEG